MHVYTKISRKSFNAHKIRSWDCATMQCRVKRFYTQERTIMDLQKRNWQREQDASKTAIGELAFLCGWVMQYPQHAAQLALDAHELARRYGQRLNPLKGDELVSRLHRNSAYRERRAALASLSDTSGRSDKTPVLIQSCRMSNVRNAILRAPTRSACR